MHDNPRTRAGYWPIAAIAASLLLSPIGRAAPPDTSAWKCERCPFAAGYRADVTAGATYVSQDAATVGDATGYDEKGGYANVDGNGALASGTHRLNWLVEDLGLDSRVVEVTGARPGTFDYRLAYRQLPRHRYDDTRTIFARAPGNSLALPAAWTYAGTTAGFADLADSLVSRDVESERRTVEIGGTYLPTRRFRLFADFQRQQSDGTNVLGAPYFTSASLLPHHFEYQTDQIDAGIRYDADRGYLKLAYYGSFFGDRFASVTWQSPFTTAAGAERSALAEAPDNDFQQLILAGSYRAAAHDTQVSFSAATGRGQQNDRLLPYTTNPNLLAPPLPRSTLDARVDTTNLALTVVSRPLRQVRVKAAIRYDERDNQTARLAWTRVIADSFLSGETESNVPYGFRRLRLNLGADYQWSGSLAFSAGYDRSEFSRDFQEVSDQTEDTGWGRLRWRANEYLEIAARGGVARRQIGRYDEVLAGSLDQNPLLRKFNLAYRYRQFGELSASVSPPEGSVTFGAHASYANDSYSGSLLGLTDSEELRLAADVSWTLSDKVSVYLGGGYDAVDARQSGSASFAAPDWLARHSDDFYSFSGGFRIAGIGDKVDLQLDYTRAEGVTGFDVIGGGGPEQFPDLRSTLNSLRARMLYRWSTKLEASLQLRYESLPTSDWALDGVAPATLPTILTLGAQPYDDEAWIVGVGFRYLLGDR